MLNYDLLNKLVFLKVKTLFSKQTSLIKLHWIVGNVSSSTLWSGHSYIIQPRSSASPAGLYEIPM